MTHRLLALLLTSSSLVACGGSKGASKASIPPPVEVAKPEPTDETMPPPVDPAIAREQMIAAALARVPTIAQDVAKLRALVVGDVPAAIQSKDEFRTFVEGEAATEGTAEEAAAESRALAAIGLLEKPVDLISANIEAAVTQAAAYYDPKTKQFKVVIVPESDQEFDMVSAHELTHAIQDQNFDLQKFMPSDLHDDAATARRFLVEGEATVTMIAYLIAKGTGADPLAPQAISMMRAQLRSFAALSSAEIGTMMSGQPEAAAAMASLPPYVLTPMFDSYMKGALAVLDVYAAGGWDAVNALYATPPASSEQMLHAVDKLVCRREAPVAVKLSATTAGKGWTSLADGVAGELGIGIYGTVWKLDDSKAMAAGWGGDAWRVFTKDDATLALWSTAWDTAADAAEFAAGMKASLATRGVTGDIRTKGTWVDVAIGCEGKACKTPLDAMAKQHVRIAAAKKMTAAETACVTKLSAAPSGAAGGPPAPAAQP